MLYKKLGHIRRFLRKKIDKKYIIIESDDWGLERALFHESISWMERKYGRENFTRWSTDSLETKEDLQWLFDVLVDFKSKFAKPPVITANFITHNIDYHSNSALEFRPIHLGFSEHSEDVRDIYKQAIKEGILFPQLHGFSHYNATLLLEYFKSEAGREAFGNSFLLAKSTIKGSTNFLHGEYSNKNGHQQDHLFRAQQSFENLFGFKSQSIIPPTYVLDRDSLGFLANNSIRIIQAANRLTTSRKSKYWIPFYWSWKGLVWAIRNARLDPHPAYKFYHDSCLRQISNAFRQKMPAIIDFHRVNFAGKYNPAYREKTLGELQKLFNAIHSLWPDVEFVTTPEILSMFQHREEGDSNNR